MKRKTIFLTEIHNPSSTSNTGDLSPNDNTLYYNEKAAITSKTYSELFNSRCQCKRRLAILKITYRDKCGRRYCIWRAANTKGITGINDASIGLPFEAIWELGATKPINTKLKVEVEVTNGCWFPFFFFHPNHAARISTRIGLLSIILAIGGLIVSIIAICR